MNDELEHDHELRATLRHFGSATVLAVVLVSFFFLIIVAWKGLEGTPEEALLRRKRNRENRELLRYRYH